MTPSVCPSSSRTLRRTTPGTSPFHGRAIGLKTLAMVAMAAGYRTTTKSRLPRHWRPTAAYTHVALNDAIEQGALFVSIIHELNLHEDHDKPQLPII